MELAPLLLLLFSLLPEDFLFSMMNQLQQSLVMRALVCCDKLVFVLCLGSRVLLVYHGGQ